jgi:hypothetical protein
MFRAALWSRCRLVPAAKSIPGAIAGGFAGKKVSEMMDKRKKK